MGLAELTKSKKWKNFMAKLYGIGAAIVIVGAMFKIQHWAFAGEMLVLGLSTEAVIFFFSAFEPPHEEVDWSLVYPELAGMEGGHSHGGGGKLSNGSLTGELDKMLEDAKVGPELIQSLGTGLRSLSENASKMNDLTDASVATNAYAEQIKGATNSMNQFAASSSKAAQSMGELSISSEEAKVYNEQIGNATKNMAALNAVYELQLQDTTTYLKSANKFYDGMNDMLSNLNSSVEQTQKYKEEITILTKNLSALNTVYGNMLSAMSTRVG